ncbi:hypothetical protein ACKWTF_012951 [Chironomus riparius]
MSLSYHSHVTITLQLCHNYVTVISHQSLNSAAYKCAKGKKLNKNWNKRLYFLSFYCLKLLKADKKVVCKQNAIRFLNSSKHQLTNLLAIKCDEIKKKLKFFCGLMLEILVTYFSCMQFNSNYEVGNYGNGGNLLLWNEVYKLLLSEVKNE